MHWVSQCHTVLFINHLLYSYNILSGQSMLFFIKLIHKYVQKFSCYCKLNFPIGFIAIQIWGLVLWDVLNVYLKIISLSTSLVYVYLLIETTDWGEVYIKAFLKDTIILFVIPNMLNFKFDCLSLVLHHKVPL